jgi:hypothetical protein
MFDDEEIREGALWIVGYTNSLCVLLTRIRGGVRLNRSMHCDSSTLDGPIISNQPANCNLYPYSLMRYSRSALNKKSVMRIVFKPFFNSRARFKLVNKRFRWPVASQ